MRRNQNNARDAPAASSRRVVVGRAPGRLRLHLPARMGAMGVARIPFDEARAERYEGHGCVSAPPKKASEEPTSVDCPQRVCRDDPRGFMVADHVRTQATIFVAQRSSRSRRRTTSPIRVCRPFQQAPPVAPAPTSTRSEGRRLQTRGFCVARLAAHDQRLDLVPGWRSALPPREPRVLEDRRVSPAAPASPSSPKARESRAAPCRGGFLPT